MLQCVAVCRSDFCVFCVSSHVFSRHTFLPKQTDYSSLVEKSADEKLNKQNGSVCPRDGSGGGGGAGGQSIGDSGGG